MENTILSLREDAVPAEKDGVQGLFWKGHTIWARGQSQAVLLRALLEGPKTAAELADLLTKNGESCDEAKAALTLAEFILDFGEELTP